jgi:hypothetical protein
MIQARPLTTSKGDVMTDTKFSIGEMVYIDDEDRAWRPNASVQGYDDDGNPIFARLEWITPTRPGHVSIAAYGTKSSFTISSDKSHSIFAPGPIASTSMPIDPLPFDEPPETGEDA